MASFRRCRQLTNLSDTLLRQEPICFQDSHDAYRVARRGGVSTPFKLQASGDAALGYATVTVRATSGSIVHAWDLPISVADQLPSC